MALDTIGGAEIVLPDRRGLYYGREESFDELLDCTQLKNVNISLD